MQFPPKQPQQSYELSQQIKLSTQLLLKNPDDVDSLYNRGCAFSLLKQYENASTDLELALRHNPQDPRLIYQLACVKELQGDQEQARLLCEKLLVLCPGHQDASFKLASFKKEEQQRICQGIVDQDPEPMQPPSYTSQASSLQLFAPYKAVAVGEKPVESLFIPVDELIRQAMIGTTSQKAQRALQSAEVLKQQGQYQRACDAITQALAAGINKDEALLLRGECLMELLKYADALEDFKQLLKISDRQKQLVLRLAAQCALKAGSPDAMALADQSLATAESADVLIIKALLFKQQGNFLQTIALCTQALHLEPQSLKALRLRAFCYAQGQQLQLSIADYSSVLKLQQSAEDLYNRAMVYVQLGQLQESAKDLTAAADLEPSPQVLKALCTNLQQQGKYALATSYGEQLAKLHTAAESDAVLASCYKTEKKFLQALELYLKIQDHTNAGYCYRKLNRWEDAVREYGKLSQPTDKDLINRAFCLARIGQFEQAILDYTMVLQHEPDSVNSLYNRGICYQKVKKADAATEDFRRCLELDPSNQQVKEVLGLIPAPQM